ncbi:MAG: [Fe-Fe] hydrogenase large subunit C-terminal domain-containing protein [Anaerolineae bacterium]
MPGVVRTIQDKCRRCYTCVRNCPAKAIKVEDGQAKVIEERCIGCGNCYKVCAQSAKEVLASIAEVQALLAGAEPVLACLAPSFPAAFPQYRQGQVVAAVHALGFAKVLEVAFGAELVGREYARFARENPGRLLITTPCPALVAYIEKYAPALVPHLAPIVSPAIALGRAIKERYLPGARVVFVGPCIAKKAEITDPNVAGAVDAALTFAELMQMWVQSGIDPAVLDDRPFDGPRPAVGRAFPVSGGLLRTAQLDGDILQNEILTIDGRDNVLELVRALRAGEQALEVRLVDVLFCEGCINGPVMPGLASALARKEAVTRHARGGLGKAEQQALEAALAPYASVNLRRGFSDRSMVLAVPSEEAIAEILRQTNKVTREDELNCGACGYETCREKAIAVYQGLAEAQMCLPYLIDQLEENVAKLKLFQWELQETQDQLIQSEKLASMGQLAAGVAHEINNPLGTVLLYADLLLRDSPEGDSRREDLRLILEEARRCKGIVQALLNFARQNKVLAQLTDLNKLCTDMVTEVERLPLFANVRLTTRLDDTLPLIQADPAQLRQALLNLLNNAAEAMPKGGTITISTRASFGNAVELTVSDTGCGIPEENLPKLFTPFFTTKPIGKGTGLGLAITYGIVKMHRGAIDVQSTVGEGTSFIIRLPVSQPADRPGPIGTDHREGVIGQTGPT